MADQNQNILQEYADNRGVKLSVDRTAGVIPGVKLLGRQSARGREYPKEVMQKAMPLYENRPVNVDHVDPGSRRSYRDRIGMIKNVALREDGLFGDFHFNPKHQLAEQLAWDAENAPQNVGFSHDARGPSKLRNGKVVVESIDRVLSVDLVANPATTGGLFEDRLSEGEIADKLADDAKQQALREINGTANDLISKIMWGDDGQSLTVAQKKAKILAVLADWEAELIALSSASDTSTVEESMDWKDIDLDGLRKNRPELVTALQESIEKGDETKTLQEELAALKAEKAERTLLETIDGELKTARLDRANKQHVSDAFFGVLKSEPDAAKRKALIEDRAGIVLSARSAAPQSAAPLPQPQSIAPATAGANPLQKIQAWGR